MRRATLVLGIVLFVAATACWAGGSIVAQQTFLASASDIPYQQFVSDVNEALFTNLTGQQVNGLRVTFSGDVPELDSYGFGASASILTNEAGNVELSGIVAPYGTIGVVWPLDGAKIIAAEWLIDGAAVAAVPLGAPIATMHARIEAAPLAFPTVQIAAVLSGTLSRSPDGTPIDSYVWEWSDGLVQNGPSITRTWQYSVIGSAVDLYDLSVTLTVTNAAGQTSSVTHRLVRPVRHIAVPV